MTVVNSKGIEWINQNVDNAYAEFLFEYLNKPSYITSHNLGTFLSKYGRECMFCPKFEKKHIVKLLNLAIAECPNFNSYCELGDFYFNSKKYFNSVKAYSKALEYKEDAILNFNYAIALYYQGEYSEIVNQVPLILNNFKYNNENKITLYKILGFSYSNLTMYDNANKIFDVLNKTYKKLDPDIIALAFYIKNYDFVIQKYDDLFNKWVYSLDIIQIIYKSFLKINPSKNGDFLTSIKNKIDEFKQENQEFQFDFDYNKLDELVLENLVYNFTPQLMYNINFF